MRCEIILNTPRGENIGISVAELCGVERIVTIIGGLSPVELKQRKIHVDAISPGMIYKPGVNSLAQTQEYK